MMASETGQVRMFFSFSLLSQKSMQSTMQKCQVPSERRVLCIGARAVAGVEISVIGGGRCGGGVVGARFRHL